MVKCIRNLIYDVLGDRAGFLISLFLPCHELPRLKLLETAPSGVVSKEQHKRLKAIHKALLSHWDYF